MNIIKALAERWPPFLFVLLAMMYGMNFILWVLKLSGLSDFPPLLYVGPLISSLVATYSIIGLVLIFSNPRSAPTLEVAFLVSVLTIIEMVLRATVHPSTFTEEFHGGSFFYVWMVGEILLLILLPLMPIAVIWYALKIRKTGAES